MPHFLARLAQARAAASDGEGAMQAIDEAIALAPSFERKAFEQRRELLKIEADYTAGNVERVSAGLATVLGDHRARGDFVFMRSRPDLAARFANHALEHDIETEFVRALIAKDALVAPPDVGSSWPFRLRVQVLGGFELVRDGQPVRFTGKAQQRPLDLLKLVVALGGEDVDIEHVMGALWPDADGAAAKSSFDSALFRLRKLLEVENAIVLGAGKLSLDRGRAWTDVWALEAALERAEDASDGRSTDASRVRAAPIPVRCSGPMKMRGSPNRAMCCARVSCARCSAWARRSRIPAIGRPPSICIDAGWKPTTWPNRCIADSCERWRQRATTPKP
jgi:hypothetical protein